VSLPLQNNNSLKLSVMKRIFIFVMLLLVMSTAFSQQLPSNQPLTQQDYVKKSKNQKTVAWILLAGGVGLIGTGLLIGNGDETSFDDAASGGIVAGVGVASALVSIPVFLASTRNKKKAMELSAGVQRFPLPFHSIVASTAVTLKLSF
jgi:hypothetical protein